jgi:hypothetical protein
MRHAARALVILTCFATGFISAATVAYAGSLPDPPLVGDQGRNAPAASPSTGLPLWLLLALAALVVLLAVASAGLGYSLSHSWRSALARRSQHPLPH